MQFFVMYGIHTIIIAWLTRCFGHNFVSCEVSFAKIWIRYGFGGCLSLLICLSWLFNLNSIKSPPKQFCLSCMASIQTWFHYLQDALDTNRLMVKLVLPRFGADLEECLSTSVWLFVLTLEPKWHPITSNAVLFVMYGIHTNMIAWFTRCFGHNFVSCEVSFAQIWGRFWGISSIPTPYSIWQLLNP